MVKLSQRFSNAVEAFVKTNNSGGTLSGRALARDFFVNGSRENMKGNWSLIRLSDKDMLKGYSYAAIDLRSKTVARLGFDVISSSYKDGSMKEGDDDRHPYIRAIEDSTNFSNYDFWLKSSKYIDMMGVRYIAFLRGITESGVVGDVMEVFALNSYRVTEVINQADGEIGGYIETQKNTGRQRIWEPHQIVRIVDENPIDNEPYGRIEAAKEAQFTLKQAGDFTRSSLNANENAPGIISTKIVLTPEQFANFKEGIKNSEKGQPIITNGGQVDWQAMNIDLDKAALDKINEIQRSELFAVTGQSKTSMGIEESGTTRDTSEVQDDKLVRDQAIPTIKLIASALDLDYRKNYPEDFKTYEWSIDVQDPTGKNLEAEQQAISVREGEFDLAQKLISQGYDIKLSRKYAKGEIDIDQLGEPEKKESPIPPIIPVEPVKDEDGEDATKDKQEQSINISPVINIPDLNIDKVVSSLARYGTTSHKDIPANISVQQISARDYPDLYDDIDIDTDDLGCIMLDLEPMEVMKYVEGLEDDLFDNPKYDQSSVPAETVPHVTLLYGLLENGNKWKSKVDQLLDGWKLDSVKIDHVGFFETADSYAVIAHLEETPELVDGHERLTLLPHINTFSEYLPHMTIAYVKLDADVDKWVKALDKAYKGKTVKTASINYGDPEEGDSDNSHNHNHDATNEELGYIYNQLETADTQIIEQQQGALTNGVVNIDNRIIALVMGKVAKNDFETQEDIIDKDDREEIERELEMLLMGFYTVLFGLYGRQLMQNRAGEFGKLAEFKMSRDVTNYIRSNATKAAKSHVDTVVGELLETVNEAYVTATEAEFKALVDSGRKSSKALYEEARKLALEGTGRQQIISAIKAAQTDISTKRATTIARNETRKAFTQTQYQADTQFLQSNGWLEVAEKRWRTNSSNPCQLCLNQAARGWIPFRENFVNKGETLTYDYEKKDGTTSQRSVVMDYEDIDAGLLHTNCACQYDLRVTTQEDK